MVEVQLMGVALGAAEVPTSLSEHFDVIYILLVAAIAIIVWFAVRAFNKVCESQDKLWARTDDFERRLSTIEGEHKVAMSKGVHK